MKNIIEQILTQKQKRGKKNMIEAIYKDGNTSLKVKGTDEEIVHEFATILNQLDELENIKPIVKVMSKAISKDQTKVEKYKVGKKETIVRLLELMEILDEVKKEVIEYASQK